MYFKMFGFISNVQNWMYWKMKIFSSKNVKSWMQCKTRDLSRETVNWDLLICRRRKSPFPCGTEGLFSFNQGTAWIWRTPGVNSCPRGGARTSKADEELEEALSKVVEFTMSQLNCHLCLIQFNVGWLLIITKKLHQVPEAENQAISKSWECLEWLCCWPRTHVPWWVGIRALDPSEPPRR